MNVKYLKKFSKDLDKVKQPKDKKALLAMIQEVKSVETINEVSGIKKLVGFQDAYRIRVGQLRVGIFLSDGGTTVEFARVAYRKDIYKVFP
jgi:mRNA interferase RelE/StbE